MCNSCGYSPKHLHLRQQPAGHPAGLQAVCKRKDLQAPDLDNEEGLHPGRHGELNLGGEKGGRLPLRGHERDTSQQIRNKDHEVWPY